MSGRRAGNLRAARHHLLVYLRTEDRAWNDGPERARMITAVRTQLKMNGSTVREAMRRLIVDADHRRPSIPGAVTRSSAGRFVGPKIEDAHRVFRALAVDGAEAVAARVIRRLQSFDRHALCDGDDGGSLRSAHCEGRHLPEGAEADEELAGIVGMAECEAAIQSSIAQMNRLLPGREFPVSREDVRQVFFNLCQGRQDEAPPHRDLSCDLGSVVLCLQQNGESNLRMSLEPPDRVERRLDGQLDGLWTRDVSLRTGDAIAFYPRVTHAFLAEQLRTRQDTRVSMVTFF